jgi:hypothetical protein
LHGLTAESNFVDPIPPGVEITAAPSPGRAEIQMIEIADAGAPNIGVKVGVGIDASSVLVSGVNGSLSGPMTLVSHGSGAGSVSLAGQRGMGFWTGSRVVGQHDGHRRAAGFTVVRRANLASPDTSTWGALTGSATVTTGKTAPDGTAGAAELSGASHLYRRFSSARVGIAVGDWVIGGVWARAVSSSNGAVVGAMEVDWSASDDIYEQGGNAIVAYMPTTTSVEWQWLVVASKMASVGTVNSNLLMYLWCDSGQAMEFYAPVLLHVPVGTYSDSEAMEVAYSLSGYPETAVAGQVTLQRDQNVHIPRGYIEMGESTAPAAGATNYGRLFMEDNGAGKTRLVVKFPTGANQVIATEP